MNVPLEEFPPADKRIPMRELIEGLQRTLARNHEKILDAARRDWERHHSAGDPSDACASIRITSRRKAKRGAVHITGLN